MNKKIESILIMAGALFSTAFILIAALVITDFIEWSFYDSVSESFKLALDIIFSIGAISIFCGWIHFFKKIKSITNKEIEGK